MTVVEPNMNDPRSYIRMAAMIRQQIAEAGCSPGTGPRRLKGWPASTGTRGRPARRRSGSLWTKGWRTACQAWGTSWQRTLPSAWENRPDGSSARMECQALGVR